MDDQTRSVKSQCQVIAFIWDKEEISDSQTIDELIKSSPVDLSNELSAVNFDKDASSAAGSFSLTLENTRDWKEIVRPGQWLLIYMSQDGDLAIQDKFSADDLPTPNLAALKRQKSKLRGLCYVERVGARGSLNEEGSLDVVYEVSGRDFGIIYEETTIWHNFFHFESGLIDAAVANLNARGPQTVDQLLSVIHDLFYFPDSFPSVSGRDASSSGQPSLAQVGYQWLLPVSLLSALDLKLQSGATSPYYGHIEGLLDLSPTKATFPIENPMSTLNGNAWEKLKSYSIQQFHELFTEIDESGNPKLQFRPIPWKTDPSGYPLIAPYVQSLLDLKGFTVAPIDIIEFDLGQDNHSRYNHFYTSIQTSDYTAFDNISELQYPSPVGRQFPYAQLNSIARHGFKPMHVEVNALLQLGLNVDGKADQAILVQYNEVVFDYWNNSIFFESGTMHMIGNNSVKIGRTISFDSQCKFNANKIFYIEGYSDHFEVNDKGVGEWTQTVKLTRGADRTAVANSLTQKKTGPRFSKRNIPFGQTGSYTRK